MQVRRAEVGAYAALGDLTIAAYARVTRGPEDPYLDRLRDVARRDREAEVWVAADKDGENLGCVTWCPPDSPWREISGVGQGEFRMLAVAPASRGRGAGETLVRHCESLSAATGATEMVLSSLDVMTDAHRLYARLGYRRVPERDWSPAPEVHLIAFEKRLD